MMCDTVCPNCQGLLVYQHQATQSRAMYRCVDCSRWFLHTHRGAQCGMLGWVGPYPKPETWTTCKKQKSLFAH